MGRVGTSRPLYDDLAFSSTGIANSGDSVCGLFDAAGDRLFSTAVDALFSDARHSRVQLTPWLDGTRTIGYCQVVPNAKTVWLMTHGNAGQAADRDYVLCRMSDEDSLYVLEYPGYGARPGSPGLKSMNEAAAEAYRLLRSQNPQTPVCVIGESIGSGPACSLAREKTPPDKIVLVVPFDSLASVAAERFFFCRCG